MGWITENTKKMKEIGFVKEWIILFLEVVTPYTIQKKFLVKGRNWTELVAKMGKNRVRKNLKSTILSLNLFFWEAEEFLTMFWQGGRYFWKGLGAMPDSPFLGRNSRKIALRDHQIPMTFMDRLVHKSSRQWGFLPYTDLL